MERRFPFWGLVGGLLIAGGAFALAADLERWNAVWYLPAWYGYLLMLDAAIFLRQGHSFVSGHRRELAAMMFWSVPFWFLFEAYNLRLSNWYYVFALRDDRLGFLVTVLAFATVLPACFFHAELLRALGLFRGARARPLAIRRAAGVICLVLGILSIAAPLALPRYAFWMVWGVTLWLPELVLVRAGAPSLLADLEAGSPGRILCLLAGGFLAGGVWEVFNFPARCKWIYTVPGFEDWKLFEMPLAGFLGFPVLAVAAFSFYSLVCHFLRGGRSWEEPDEQTSHPVSPWIHGGAAVAAALFSICVYLAVLDRTVQSRRPLLSELSGLDPASVATLDARGVPTPERLHRAVSRHGLAQIARETGVTARALERAARHAALALHKGMGTDAAALLSEAGIATVRDLAGADPEALYARVSSVARRSGREPPRLAIVKVWVRAADPSGKPRR